MNKNLDELMIALACISGEDVKPCRMELCPYFDKYDPNAEYADWPCDFMEIAKAAMARIQKLESNTNKPE